MIQPPHKPRIQGFYRLSEVDKEWLILALSDPQNRLCDILVQAKNRNIKTSMSSLSRFYHRFEAEIRKAQATRQVSPTPAPAPAATAPMVTIENKNGRIVFNLTFTTPQQPPVDIFIDGKQVLAIEARPSSPNPPTPSRPRQKQKGK